MQSYACLEFQLFDIPDLYFQVSSQESRQNARVQLPIKVKNYRLFFVLDMKGEFQNPKLFDHTAGLKREWKT